MIIFETCKKMLKKVQPHYDSNNLRFELLPRMNSLCFIDEEFRTILPFVTFRIHKCHLGSLKLLYRDEVFSAMKNFSFQHSFKCHAYYVCLQINNVKKRKCMM